MARPKGNGQGSVYPKNGRLYLSFYGRDGKRKQKATPFKVGQEKQARALLAKVNQRIADGEPEDLSPETVKGFGERYLKKRVERVTSGKSDQSRLRLHVFPRIGSMRLDEVKPRHMEELIWALREAGNLAPRSIIHTWGALSRLFKAAVREEFIAASPCLLEKGVLPKNKDKDPSWRDTAIYSRDELEKIIADPRTPWSRRILYGLKFLAGLRHEESATATWGDYDATREPLGCLTVPKTKTGVTRYVPVHPVLASMLAEWKLSGWQKLIGRNPEADDLICPTSSGTVRVSNVSRDLHADLDALGYQPRRGHDMKRTHISLLNTDRARRDLTKIWTHGAPGSILDVYTTIEWPVLCDEMVKLKIALLKRGDIIPVAKAATGIEEQSFCYVSATTDNCPPQKGSTEPIIRLERTTYGLRNHCSTN